MTRPAGSRNIRWTAEIDAQLAASWAAGEPGKVIAIRLGVWSHQAIFNRARRLGLGKHPRFQWSTEADALASSFDGLCARGIAVLLTQRYGRGFTASAVRARRSYLRLGKGRACREIAA